MTECHGRFHHQPISTKESKCNKLMLHYRNKLTLHSRRLNTFKTCFARYMKGGGWLAW
ncbi:MAG: hypothetical protein JWP63_6611 [Candidatus Solibacter sp.]|jgi:hypothetical protein|nr:hypothetical protein [Candidatus Solibacter sp.]